MGVFTEFFFFLFCIELRPCKATNRKHEVFDSSCKFSAGAQIEKFLVFKVKKRTWKRIFQVVSIVMRDN